jgi:hypothetical protein
MRVPFVYVVFGAMEVLKLYNYVTPEKLQRFISEDDTFKIRPPLSSCKLALHLLEGSGVIRKEGKEYIRDCG